MNKDDKELLFKLFELTYQDESEHIQLEQKNLGLYTGLQLAIIGGILFVLKDIDDSLVQILTLFFGGILIITFSYLGFNAYKSSYRRHLEAIAMRAKLEDLLGFNKGKFKGKEYWRDEGLILTRYFNDRKEYQNSKEFVDIRIDMGLASTVKKVFFSLSIIGSLFILLGIIKSYTSLCV